MKVIKTTFRLFLEQLGKIWRGLGNIFRYSIERIGVIGFILSSILGLGLTIFLPQIMVAACVALAIRPIREPFLKWPLALLIFVIAEFLAFVAAEIILIVGVLELARFLGFIVERFTVRLVEEHMREITGKKENFWEMIKNWFVDLRKPMVA